MSSDLDDQWLYGTTENEPSPVKAKEEPAVLTIKENGNGTRALTPTLDDEEVALAVPTVPPVNKIVSTAPDLQPKQPTAEDALLAGEEPEKMETGEGDGEQKKLEEGEAVDSDSDDDEDDVQITIGDIATAPGGAGYTRTPSYTRIGTVGTGVTGSSAVKRVDLEAIPQVSGQSLLDYDLDATDKPWRLPGADIADYFNYGFTEETWKGYCEKQRKMKGEVNQLNKIAVRSVRPGIGHTSIFPEPKSIPSIGIPPPSMIPNFPPHLPIPPPFMLPPPVSLPSIPVSVHSTSESKSEDQPDGESKTPEQTDPNAEASTGDNASDGRATPGVDVPPSSSSTKLPLLPPPNIPPSSVSMPPRGMGPPPFGLPPPGFPGMPPTQDIAAAMAAMFGRPPDQFPPPQMHPNMPPFPPPGFPSDGMLPPHGFPGMPPHFPMHTGDHGPLLDVPPEMSRLLGQFPWDPSMGPPPQELLDAFSHRDHRGGSRSRSRSSSYSRSRSRSRSSSFDDRGRSGRKRERRHRRASRSKSHDRDRDKDRDRDRERDRDRDRHKSSRHHRNADHHRSDRHDRDRDRERDRDRDRDRDRERERDSRKRREHREEKSSRHERSSRRHRSSSRGRDEERSSRKEKSSKAAPAAVLSAPPPSEPDRGRESRSRSRTPTS